MDRGHWDDVWRDRVPEDVTWFQAEHEVSRRLIAAVASSTDGIVDVGGGASRLVDHLLADGYADVTVVDIASASLDAARHRLGASGDRVRWVVGDITSVDLGRTFDVWHDRAVFHFLVDAGDRERYLGTLRAALDPGGHLVLATFGPDGPDRCSGLPVRRYGTDLMDETLGPDFERLHDELEEHVAPSGITQQFLYGLFRRLG